MRDPRTKPAVQKKLTLSAGRELGIARREVADAVSDGLAAHEGHFHKIMAWPPKGTLPWMQYQAALKTLESLGGRLRNED